MENKYTTSRYKEEIESISEEEGDKVLLLNPVIYKYKVNDVHSVGFIAEEVHNIYPKAVYYDRHGEPDAIYYDRFIPYLVKKIQMMDIEIKELKEKLKGVTE